MKLKFFELARKLSNHSDYPDHKLGAVITRGNKIISVGFNKRKTHPESKSRFSNIHAEFSAIIRAKEDLTNCSIYVYRETKDGKLAMAKPCNSCDNLIREIGIKKVYYSSEEGFKSYEI